MSPRALTLTIIGSILFIMFGVAGGLYGCPKYKVWQQGLQGEAELKRAEQNRQVQVVEARARLDATTLNAESAIKQAKFQAQAEVERAKGVAEANKIIADGLKGNDEYLRYLWIDKIADKTGREIIYVPTEAGMPILESSRLKVTSQAEQR